MQWCTFLTAQINTTAWCWNDCERIRFVMITLQFARRLLSMLFRAFGDARIAKRSLQNEHRSTYVYNFLLFWRQYVLKQFQYSFPLAVTINLHTQYNQTFVRILEWVLDRWLYRLVRKNWNFSFVVSDGISCPLSTSDWLFDVINPLALAVITFPAAIVSCSLTPPSDSQSKLLMPLFLKTPFLYLHVHNFRQGERLKDD